MHKISDYSGMPKIAILVQHLQHGGAELNATKLANALLRMGWKVDVVVYSNKSQQYSCNAQIVDMRLPPGHSLLAKYLISILRFLRFSALRMINRYDAVISFLFSADLLNVLTGFLGGESIITVRNYISLSSVSVYEKYVYKWIYRFSFKIISSTNQQIDDLVVKFLVPRSKILRLSNFFDIGEIRALSEKPIEAEWMRWFRSKPTFVSIGRISIQKGQWNAIALINELNSMGMPCNLAIIGAEDDLRVRDFCRDLIRSYGLDSNIKFLGAQYPPYSLLRQSGLLLLTSFYEGFPNVLVEAMAVGCVVIATNCPSGPNEILDTKEIRHAADIVNSHNGILLPVPTIRALSVDFDWVRSSGMVVFDLINNRQFTEKLRHEAILRAQLYSEETASTLWDRELRSLL